MFEEYAFVLDHKFSTLQQIVDYRTELAQQIESLMAQRAEIAKQMRRKNAPPQLADQRAAITAKIAVLRKEDKLAETAIRRTLRTKEAERIDRENQKVKQQNNRRREQQR